MSGTGIAASVKRVEDRTVHASNGQFAGDINQNDQSQAAD
jgi:hypothetical protein